MFNYNLIKLPNFDINKKYVDKIFKIIQNKVNTPQNWTINLIFLDNKSIQKLNNKHRKINKPTDVLSFHYYDNFNNLEKDEIAWEIIFSENKIISQWKEYKLWTEKEFYKLLIHSILHILWYEHISDKDYKIMQKYENNILTEIFEK